MILIFNCLNKKYTWDYLKYIYHEYSGTQNILNTDTKSIVVPKKKKKIPNVFGNLEQHAKRPMEPKFQPFWKVLEYIK